MLIVAAALHDLLQHFFLFSLPVSVSVSIHPPSPLTLTHFTHPLTPTLSTLPTVLSLHVPSLPTLRPPSTYLYPTST